MAYIGKLIEKVVAKRLTGHKHRHALEEEEFQSSYKAGHSTERALLKIHDVSRALDQRKGALMLYLDFSAAFDTLDRVRLLTALKTRYGIHDTTLSWSESYLTGRTQRVRINHTESCEMDSKHAVSQGSVLGPVLFSIYSSPTEDILKRYSIMYHKYADDMTLYVLFDPAVPVDLPRVKARLVACFNGLHS